MTSGYFLFRAKSYGLAVVSVTAALVVRLLLQPVLEDHLPYSFFFVAVIFTAWKAGTGETLLATFLGLFAAAWFLVPPRHSLAIAGADGWWGAALYVFVCLAILWFMKSEHAARLRALGDEVEVRKHREELQRLQRRLELTQSTCSFLANIVQTAPDAMFSLSDEGRIATWNSAAEKLFGFSAAQAVGESITLILPARFQKERERILDAVSRGEPASRWETMFTGSDGSAIPVLLTISPVQSGGGEILGASVIVRHRADSSVVAPR